MNEQRAMQPGTAKEPTALAEIRDGLDRLEQVINEHEKRIAVILVNSELRNDDDKPCAERNPESKLTEEKREVAEMIDRLQGLVISLTQRVQM